MSISKETLQTIFDDLSYSDKQQFIDENISFASDDSVDDAYEVNHPECAADDMSPADDLTYMEDPQRCNVLAEILANFARTRIPLTADEAVNTVRDMYNFMSWH